MENHNVHFVTEQRHYVKLELSYKYYQLGTDFTREEVLEMFPGARTFPQIKVNGKSIGGYDGFPQYLEETNYNGTGNTI